MLSAKYKDNVEDVTFFVVEPELESVLSGNICIKLGLLKRVNQLTSDTPPERTVELNDYPELFKGLGCLLGMYHIEQLMVLPLLSIPQGRYQYLSKKNLLKN